MYTIDDANGNAIADIALHFLETNLSLRKFTEQYCEFSYVTLRDKFLNKLPYVNNELGILVSETLNKRNSKHIEEDKEAQVRVLQATKYLLEQNLTVEEIANLLNSTIMTIYRDLTVRLQQMSETSLETKKKVLLKLREHSLENLIPKGGRH